MRDLTNDINRVLNSQGEYILKQDFLDVSKLISDILLIGECSYNMLLFASQQFDTPIDIITSKTRKREVVTAKHCFINLVHRQHPCSNVNQCSLMSFLNMGSSGYSATIKRYNQDNQFKADYDMFESEYIKSLNK